MSSPPAPAPPPRWPWRLLALGAAAIPLGLHVDYIVRDERLPRDLGLFYQHVPDMHRQLTGTGGGWPELSDVLAGTGYWYELVLALWLRVFGASIEAFRAVDVLWLAATLALIGLSARALRAADAGGRDRAEPAGALALILATAVPFIAVFARQSWIHVVETALVLGAALPWLRDPRLSRTADVVLPAVLGALACLLRPSALPWLAPLGLAMAFGVRGARPTLPRLAVIGGTWLLAAVPALLELNRYLATKVAARERYAHDVPVVLEQLTVGVGPLALLAAVLGLLGLGWLLRRRAVPGTPLFILGLWAAMPVVLWALFRAGMDNFTLGWAALAVLGGVGLSAAPRLGLVPVLAAAAFIALPRLPQVQARTHQGPVAVVMAQAGMPARSNLGSPYRPFVGYGVRHIDTLLDAACPEEGRCLVAVDQGLNVPYSEEPGALGLYLSGHPEARLLDLRDRLDVAEVDDAHVLVHWSCGEEDIAWRQRFPKGLDNLMLFIEQRGFAPVWQKRVTLYCTVLWFAPDGQLLDPDVPLPPDGVVGTVGPAVIDPTGASPSQLEYGGEGLSPGEIPAYKSAADEARERMKPRGDRQDEEPPPQREAVP